MQLIICKPLTIEIEVNWEKAMFEGSFEDGICEIHDKKRSVNMIYGNEFILS